jgi:hypothetical protein
LLDQQPTILLILLFFHLLHYHALQLFLTERCRISRARCTQLWDVKYSQNIRQHRKSFTKRLRTMQNGRDLNLLAPKCESPAPVCFTHAIFFLRWSQRDFPVFLSHSELFCRYAELNAPSAAASLVFFASHLCMLAAAVCRVYLLMCPTACSEVGSARLFVTLQLCTSPLGATQSLCFALWLCFSHHSSRCCLANQTVHQQLRQLFNQPRFLMLQLLIWHFVHPSPGSLAFPDVSGVSAS